MRNFQTRTIIKFILTIILQHLNSKKINERKIWTIGTICYNRLKNCPHLSENFITKIVVDHMIIQQM